MIGTIAVFCGSRPGHDPRHAAAARALGRGIAERGLRLVYGGGRVGLMGMLADAALAAGGTVVGVIPEDLFGREVGHQGLGELRVVRDLAARKQVMADLADLFVALPGGIGTIDEMVEMMTWRQLGVHAKPVLLLDADYWHPFMAALDHARDAGFLDAARDRLFVAVEDVPAAFAWIDHHVSNSLRHMCPPAATSE